MLAQFCLIVTRISLGCWIGAAAFFVSVSLKPMRMEQFDTVQKATLAQTYFPGYYAFALGCLGPALCSSIGSYYSSRSGRRFLQLILIGLASLVILVDWLTIYQELARIVDSQVREFAAPPAHFREYHLASRWINTVAIGISFLGLVTACLDDRKPPRASE